MSVADVERLRVLAEEAREAAARATDPDAKRVLLFIAAAYERLAAFSGTSPPEAKGPNQPLR
jgi:hypothetical protein